MPLETPWVIFWQTVAVNNVSCPGVFLGADWVEGEEGEDELHPLVFSPCDCAFKSHSAPTITGGFSVLLLRIAGKQRNFEETL